jgi:hypothetical protein
MGLLEDSHLESLGSASLEGVSGCRGLRKHEQSNLLSLVSHDNIWLVRVLVGVQYISLKSLILI